MKRQELEELGLNKEQIDAVMKINGADIENAKSVSASEVESLKKENESLSVQVSDRDKQLENLRKEAGDNENLKTQIENLQAENKTAKENHESEMNNLKINFAVERALTEAKARNVKAAKAMLDLENAKLDKDGNVEGLDLQIENLSKDESTRFLFYAQEGAKFTGFQPGTSENIPQTSGNDISKMSYEQVCAYMDSNAQ